MCVSKLPHPASFITKQKKSALVWRIFRDQWTLPLILLTTQSELSWDMDVCGEIPPRVQSSLLRFVWNLGTEVVFPLWEGDKEHRKTVNEQSVVNKKVLLRLQLYRGYTEMDDFWMEENVLETPADFRGRGRGKGEHYLHCHSFLRIASWRV